jgi:hypothetical protein
MGLGYVFATARDVRDQLALGTWRETEFGTGIAALQHDDREFTGLSACFDVLFVEHLAQPAGADFD